MNLRPSGYEPDELPGCSTPREVLEERFERVVNEIGIRPLLVIGCSRVVCERSDCLRFAGLAATYSPAS